MERFRCRPLSIACVAAASLALLLILTSRPAASGVGRDDALAAVLRKAGFTGKIGKSLEARLGRKVDKQLANVGRLVWFDNIGSLNDDNTCGGCHSPTAAFGDTQSIAIGVDNNGIVGPDRAGPRNQRRTPSVVNAAFYPALMWNSRFASLSGDPFDNSAGFIFPAPEGLSLSRFPHLLQAQAFIPPTERVEAAGFTFPGDPTNLARDHELILGEVLTRLNATPAYRKLFGKQFRTVRAGGPIIYDMVAAAIAEFQFTLVFADAPVDRFARGDRDALTESEKKGALLFFGKADCVSCHAVGGQSNEMFSDFKQHVIGVPQICPTNTNVVFDGPGANEDFGLEQVTGNPADRYGFRTSPLRNAALQPAFFHNGSFTKLEDAIRHHLDVFTSAREYVCPSDLDTDLLATDGTTEAVLAKVDPRLATPKNLTRAEVRWLTDFVGNGLLDPNASPEKLRKLIPKSVPSGRAVPEFQ